VGGLVRSPYGAASAPTLQLGVTCGASIEDKDAKGSAKGVWVDGGTVTDDELANDPRFDLSAHCAHWVDAEHVLLRAMDTDESGLPLRFFLHASPTATLRPTRSGLVSRERPIPAGLAPEEDTVRASWTEQSPSTPSAYAVSLFDSVRTKGRRSVASTESSDVAPTEARKSRGDEGSGTDPSAATLDLEVVGTWADLPAATRASRPYLSGCLALRLPASASPALLRGMLQGQVALSAVDSSGALVRSTGVQLPGALDALCAYDGHLGAFVDRATNHVTISVWAPTALSVRILLFRGPRDPEPFHAAPMQPGAKGAWHARGPAEGRGSWDRAYYQFEVRAYHPATGAVEDMVTTDPYARACSADGERSLVVHQDMRDPDLTPQGWGESEPRAVDRPTDAVIYELHVRDFSATDPTVPEDARGKFLAFTLPDTAGSRHLRDLHAAGVTHLHLLPIYDFATVPERETNRRDVDAASLEAAGVAPTSQVPQARLAEVAAVDSYNWGYDPVHYMAPEGSYATDPDGVARIVEARAMVEALHKVGLNVVIDVVYNHTYASGPHSRYSVLDKLVPGYYHRLSEEGRVLDSTCCNNTATEHRMMARLVLDDILHWVCHYRVDGLRFDIMGHLPKSLMMEAKRRLAQLTVSKDGVDGSRIYMYGEGWNFAEMVNNARCVNAHAGNLTGCGIGSFNDRIRDKTLGGGPFSDPRAQGFVSGLGYLPRSDKGLAQGTVEEQWRELGHQTDVLKLCMAGTVRAARARRCGGGGEIRGDEFRFPDGTLVAFAEEPAESINYVACHDNRTLWDLIVFKAPMGTPRRTLVRMTMLAHSMVVLAQGVPFVGAGDEILRSKCLDRDSYNSGDWFNRVDWSGSTNHFGRMGLPPAEKNRDLWGMVRPTCQSY